MRLNLSSMSFDLIATFSVSIDRGFVCVAKGDLPTAVNMELEA